MEEGPGLLSNDKDLYDESIENLCERWRKLQREKELRVQDQLKRIESFEYQKINKEIEIEQKELKKQKEELKIRLRELNSKILKKPKKEVKKIASRKIREICQG